MKVSKKFLKVASGSAVVAGLIAGCTTPTIDVKMNTAGEINLTGVSKIALMDFNTLPNDAFTAGAAVGAADKETCDLVKRAVAASFYSSPMYQIVDLDVEKEIFDKQKQRPDKRFDAVIYGRLWWQIAPETSGTYPQKFTLKEWKNETYVDPLGKEVTVPVTLKTEDVVEHLDYKTSNATLMLTLSVYRIGTEGGDGFEKIVDTYQVTNDGFTLMNGELKVDSKSVGLVDNSALARLKKVGGGDEEKSAYEQMFVQPEPSLAEMGKQLAGIGSGLLGAAKDAVGVNEEAPKDTKHDANGRLILTQKTVAMPTELQAKLMLASSVANTLGAKLAPTEQTFKIKADMGDARLTKLLENGAYQSTKEYAIYMLRMKLGKQVCAKLAAYIPEFDAPCSYVVPDSTTKFQEYDDALITAIVENGFKLYFYTLGTAHVAAIEMENKAKFHDQIITYLAGQKLDVYFYALAVSQEALRETKMAGESYRFAFNVKPTLEAAAGISRVHMALGESDRVADRADARDDASDKTDI